MKLIKVTLLIAFSVLVYSCSGSGEKDSSSAPVVTIKTPVVSSEGGSQFITIDADGEWTVSSAADWVQFSPESGTGMATAVVVSYEANETLSARTAAIKATSSGKSGSAVLTQNGKTGGSSATPYIEPEESTYTINAAGGLLEIRLNTNVRYTSEVEDNAKSWISASTANAASFTIGANTGASSRTGKISFYSEDKSVSADVTVIQNSASVQPAASVNTGAAEGITVSSAVFTALYSNASSAPVAAGFLWGETNSLGKDAKISALPSGVSGSLSVSVSGLSANTTYYYRAYVVIKENQNQETFLGSVRSFTTLEDSSDDDDDSNQNVSGNQRGWFELPLMNITVSGEYMYDTDNPTDYYAYHICPDVYSGGKKARNYTVCFSGEHHCPLWVAAPRHAMYEVGSGRTDAYNYDPDIPLDIQYKSKSAGSGSGCNRGHMLGSAERTVSTQTNAQVFYMSNIAPQLSSGFNTGGGGWNTLEGWVDSKVCSDTLYVVIGTYFDKFTDGYGNTVSPKKITYAGRSDVSFPTMFYYVLMRTKRGSTGKSLKDCTASEIMCAAFVRAHSNNLKGQKVTYKEMMSVSALEKLTGITYFPNVPNAPKSTVTASDWGL